MNFLNYMEMRDKAFDYIQSLVPTWPPYVVQDLLYKGLKNHLGNAPKFVSDFIRNNGFSDPSQAKWQLMTLPITLNIFDPNTKEMLELDIKEFQSGSAEGKDQQRHLTQNKLIQQAPSREPIILVKHAGGYRLEEGRHRTIQSLINWPQGYQQQAWVLDAPRSYNMQSDIWGQ